MLDYILKVAAEANMQLTQQMLNLSDYESVFSIQGKPILPPLLSPERRLEMQQYRLAAMAVEQQLPRRPKQQSKTNKHMQQQLPQVAQTGDRVDASTSTEFELETPATSLTVLGRFKQQLQLSETLIYDNKCNAIIKRVRSPPRQLQQLQYEQQPKLQLALVKPAPEAGTLESSSLELLLEKAKPLPLLQPEPEPEPVPCKAKQRLKLERVQQRRQLKEDNSILPLIDSSRLLQQNIIKMERHRERLQRSLTQPAMHANIYHKPYQVERRERLHSSLWKRFHTYPIYNCHSMERAAPSSPNGGSSLALFLPCAAAARRSAPPMEQQLQPHASSTPSKQQRAAPAASSPQKLIYYRPAAVKRATATPSYAAHASSHANDSASKMSSTQRRLSYDPRATLKRSSLPRKSAGSSSNLKSTPTPTPAATEPPSSTADSSSIIEAATPTTIELQSESSSSSELKRRKLLEEMEQQQRKRFQQLVAQQADEQQRMQNEFQAQQQLIMDQLLGELSSYDSAKQATSTDDSVQTSSLFHSCLEQEQQAMDIARALYSESSEPSLEKED
ncbi:maker243 [Drosophila busckii]|uniref:Maker243 n=1 Tax=Drosophila busckii TaxID=30019 RepID=A0A0M5J0E4_DROBS|nr:uncharacterized protein LOC108602037 [Drosophila busckii]ALC47611.1 maker243 [Drosophila busckii]